MSMSINDECISCGACEPECPNEAISEGDEIYVVEATKCTECVGEHDEPQCVDVCPVDDCITITVAESKEILQARYEALHA